MENNIILPEYYLSQGNITDPKEYKSLFDSLPDNVPCIVNAVQGLFLHIFWAQRYGVNLTKQQLEHVQSRYVSNILDTIISLDASPLIKARPFENRFIGNCRDFSVFLCSILRSKGIPSRARCGFARYFTPGKFEDHWICEYWNYDEKRWVGVDAQLDSLQRGVLGIGFDLLDVPSDMFFTGADAWKVCRSGSENPDDFGIADMHGLWFVRGDMVRDLAALNKMELLPWDSWGLIDREDKNISDDDYKLLDRVSDMVINNDDGLYELYNENESLKVPNQIRSYTSSGVIEVSL